MMKSMWLALVAAGAVLPLAAFGHAKLLSTVPATGEQLATAPKQLTLQFNESVQIGALRLSGGGKDIPIAVDRGAPASSKVTVALPELGPATYRVQWSALTVDDGHVVKGSFSFVIRGVR